LFFFALLLQASSGGSGRCAEWREHGCEFERRAAAAAFSTINIKMDCKKKFKIAKNKNEHKNRAAFSTMNIKIDLNIKIVFGLVSTCE